MPIPRRGYVDGAFGQIHYQSLGHGPAVMLLHQAPMTAAQFDNVYEPLARQDFLTNKRVNETTLFLIRIGDHRG